MSKKIAKLNEVDQELKELEKRKKHLENTIKIKRKSEERKRRARRLIETGALAEKYFEIQNLTIQEREQLFKMFSTFIKSNKPKHLNK